MSSVVPYVTQAGVVSTVCFKEILTFLGMRILRIVSWREIDLFMKKQQGTRYVMHIETVSLAQAELSHTSTPLPWRMYLEKPPSLALSG